MLLGGEAWFDRLTTNGIRITALPIRSCRAKSRHRASITGLSTALETNGIGWSVFITPNGMGVTVILSSFICDGLTAQDLVGLATIFRLSRAGS